MAHRLAPACWRPCQPRCYPRWRPLPAAQFQKYGYPGHLQLVTFKQKVQNHFLKVLRVPWVGDFAEFLHSAGQGICSLPRSRINRIDDAWTPAGWSGLWREPIEIAKQIEPGLHVLTVRKVRPSVLMNVPRREPIG
jgi:hypothetical protein